MVVVRRRIEEEENIGEEEKGRCFTFPYFLLYYIV